MKKKVLVMGGSYFIGKKTVQVLLDEQYEVYTLNRRTREVYDERIISLKADRNDEEKLKSAIAAFSFDCVVDISGLNKMQAEILWKSLNKEKLSSFIFLSSSAVYDLEKAVIPIKESEPLKENKYWTFYGKNKIEAEEYYQEVMKDLPISLTVLRPPYVYGEDNYAQRESFMFDHILSDKPVLIPDGSTKLQFIYTTDLAEIICILLKNEQKGIQIYNVGNEKGVTIREWVEACAETVGKKVTLIEYDYRKSQRNERDFFPFFNYDNVLDVSRIKEIYPKETDFLEGLERAYQWFLRHRHEIIFKEQVSANEKTILDELAAKDA